MGEKQRILIARALLKKDAKIFIFDEATSNLDAFTEEEILDDIKEMLKGKTIIFCAHRLTSIKNADKIHVLNAGRICEQGTHEELMELKYYRELDEDSLSEEGLEELGQNEFKI
jgi:ATP-binding cassette subfamily B protein